MSVEIHWLTEAVTGIADRAAVLDQELAARPGDSLLRTERREARNLLRALLARQVYAEHPNWVYRQQYELYVAREREALTQAKARLDEKAGAAT